MKNEEFRCGFIDSVTILLSSFIIHHSSFILIYGR